LTRYPDCVSYVGALGGLHLQRFPDSAESGHMEYSPDCSQGKSPSRLRLDQVQRQGPPATPHDIIHSALSELEWLLEFQDTNHKRFLTSLHTLQFQLDFPWNSIFTSSSHNLYSSNLIIKYINGSIPIIQGLSCTRIH